MLTRLRFKQNYRLIITRCLSDKSSDKEGKTLENKTQPQDEEKKTNESSARVHELLKSMLTESKIKDSEYREKFTTARERPKERKQKADKIEVKMEKIEENIIKAATDVAQAIGGDVKQTESELLSKVLGKINQTSTSLSDLLIGMKVERSKETDESLTAETRGQQVKRMISKSQTQSRNTRYGEPKSERQTQTRERRSVSSSLQPAMSINIFSGEPLGIFKSKEPNYGTKLEVWDRLNERETTLATTQPPANYFQKMILWTEQGIVWKFPINNEQGMEEEENVHFSEHIFLDSHLDDWCPKKGPIRHFMELVCVGLSKNAFYTVQEKKDHIMWYKEYFESKKNLLTEIGAWDNAKLSNDEAST